MNKSLIEELLLELLKEDSEAPQEKPAKPLIGEYVIVRCRDAGVHAGYLYGHDNRNVLLHNSRRLWRWKSAGKSMSLSDVALHGLDESGSKIPPELETIILCDACEIIPCTDVAEKSISGAKAYEAN